MKPNVKTSAKTIMRYFICRGTIYDGMHEYKISYAFVTDDPLTAHEIAESMFDYSKEYEREGEMSHYEEVTKEEYDLISKWL